MLDEMDKRIKYSNLFCRYCGGVPCQFHIANPDLLIAKLNKLNICFLKRFDSILAICHCKRSTRLISIESQPKKIVVVVVVFISFVVVVIHVVVVVIHVVDPRNIPLKFG